VIDCVTKSSATAEMACTGDHCIIQGHARSTILAPMGSPYM